MATSRRFTLWRDVDVSGISGVGAVADGVVFNDGLTVLHWRGRHRSTTVFATVADAEAIHGHNGATRLVFHDDEPQEVD